MHTPETNPEARITRALASYPATPVAKSKDAHPNLERWDLGDFRVVLAFEDRVLPPAVKVNLIVQHFKVSPVRYFQRLNAIIDTKEALEHNPVLVNRLRENREKRTSQRQARTLGRGR